MSQGNVKSGAGRTAGGIALGALLALIAPLFLLTEVFVPVAIVLLPSIALIALYRWAGRTAALTSAVLMLAASMLYGGAAMLLVVLLLMVLPPLAVLRLENRPFFAQLRAAIAAFGAGVVLSVAVLHFSFGGNMIERVLSQFPEMIRALPEEYVAPMLEYLSGALGRTLSLDAFYELYDTLIAEMIRFYQIHLPERLFGGALISALMCAWLSNRMRARRGEAAPGSYVPLRDWALPASTTGGILLLLVAGWGLDLAGMQGAETVYYAVYGIACVAFSVQTIGSAARRLRTTKLRPGAQRGALVAIAAAGYLWLPEGMLVYGIASAIFGSRGVMWQRARDREDDGRSDGER